MLTNERMDKRMDGRTDKRTDGHTDGRTDRPSYRNARTYLKRKFGMTLLFLLPLASLYDYVLLTEWALEKVLLQNCEVTKRQRRKWRKRDERKKEKGTERVSDKEEMG